jgi:hypothetical protein
MDGVDKLCVFEGLEGHNVNVAISCVSKNCDVDIYSLLLSSTTLPSKST